MRIIGLIFCLSYAFNAFAYKYDISMCCITQNEDRFLKEWIDYHRLVGVEHFYIYDNLSADQTREILDPYVVLGIVDYFFWDRNYETPREWWRVQCDAYTDALERAKKESKWLCIIDTDEFIVPIQDLTLNHFLKDFESFGGVCLNWVCFGTSGISKIPAGSWMTTSLLHRAKLSYNMNRVVKSIVRPERVNPHLSYFPHICSYYDGFFQVNANKIPFQGETTDICIDRIRLHHYWCRDIHFLTEVKIPRHVRWYGEKRRAEVWQEANQMNACFDDSILKIIDREIYLEQDASDNK